ncbi:hypothetical protein Leryth_011893 [Lithospermum erythrorhizon]|uniref:Ribosomal protein S14 n=1 Tax=Lithospermum erythrorhizon TaxID=34254 RepID=A0AAV3PT70_LITER|nr:hypothetical protein Leryth_011893 [Lithospermum erythrorhizon]
MNHISYGTTSAYSSSFRMDHHQIGYTDMEKRQLFLRSYQFSRKKSVTERIKGSFFRVKRVASLRLKSARKMRKMVWSRLLKYGFFCNRRRRFRFLRLHNLGNYPNCPYGSNGFSSCFW